MWNYNNRLRKAWINTRKRLYIKKMDVLSFSECGRWWSTRPERGSFPLLHVCLLDCKRNYTHTVKKRNTSYTHSKAERENKFNLTQTRIKLHKNIILHCIQALVVLHTHLYLLNEEIFIPKQTKTTNAMHFPTCIFSLGSFSLCYEFGDVGMFNFFLLLVRPELNHQS